MVDNSILQTYNGLIRFYDGTVIAIETVQYSADGLYNWETIFNPYDHISTLDGITPIKGHKYRRVKHTGDVNFQLPYRITPKEPEFRLNEGLLQWKFIEDSEWITLLDTITLKGDKGDTGDQGIAGTGLEINAVGYYLNRPDCCGTLPEVSSCTSCNHSYSSDVSAPYLFLSLGDGMKLIDISDVGKYYSATGLTGTWIEIVATDIDKEVRFIALDNIGTGSIDYRLQDTLNTRGKVYICADGKWTEFINLNVPIYMVGETFGSSNIGFLDNFVDSYPGEPTVGTTITINGSGKLDIIQYSIDATAFKQGTFTDGLDYNEGDTEVKVKVEDFSGYGLSTYTSTDNGEEDIQVNLTNLVSDGIDVTNVNKINHRVTTLDGETPILLKITIEDVLNAPNGTNTIYTGLVNSANYPVTKGGPIEEDDWFQNLYIKPADCIATDVDGVNVIADEDTIEAKDLLALRVKEEGIKGVHIHTGGNNNVFNTLYGFNVANIDVSGVEIKIATDAPFDNLAFKGTGELKLNDNGIYARHLNDDILGTDSGLILNHDDGLLVKLKLNGGILKDADGLYLDTTDFLTDNVVKSIKQGVTTLRNDVWFLGATNTFITTNVNLITSPNNTVTTDAVLNLSALEARLIADGFYNGTIPGSSYVTNTGTPNWDTTTDIKDYIDGLKHVVLNKWYNNIRVNEGSTDSEYPTVYGLLIRPTSGSTNAYKIIVDDNGNLDTVLVS